MTFEAVLFYPNDECVRTPGDFTDKRYMGVQRPRAIYKEVWNGFVKSSGNEGAEEVFIKFNIGDRGGLKCRSMSVGDVVKICDKYFLCDSVGWVEVKKPLLYQ